MSSLKSILITLIILLAGGMQLHGMNYGVKFHAHMRSPEQRTTLVLNDGTPMKVRDIFSVDFIAELRREESTQYGDFMEIKGDDGTSIRIMISSASASPVLVINDRLFPGAEIPFDGTTDVSLRLDRDASTVVLLCDGKAVVSAPCNLASIKEAIVIFGQQVHRDVAPINVSDIRISNNGHTDYFWRLKSHEDSVSLDSVTGAHAVAVHPEWIADAHSIMRRVYSFTTSDETMQIAFDASSLRLFVATDSTMTLVSLADSTSVTTPVEGGMRALRYSGSMFYIPEGRLMSLNAGNNTVSWYDFNTRRWSLVSGDRDGAKYGGHSWAIDGRYGYAFGGYGFHMYKNNMFVIDTLSDTIVERRLTPTPCPRSASAMAVADGKLYIFGGHGNESGRQEFDTRYYYDLYEYDLRTLSGEKLWEMDSTNYDFLCSQTMIYEPATKSFIVGTTRYGGQLVRISRDRPGLEPVTEALSIPISMRAIVLQLFYSEIDSSYYFIVDLWQSDLSHEVGVYVVTAPLERVPDLRYDEAMARKEHSGMAWWRWLAGGVVLSCCVMLMLWSGRRLKRKSAGRPDGKDAHIPVDDVASAGSQCDVSLKSVETSAINTCDEYSHISLVGAFAVKDKDGADMTARFSAKTRDLLVFLLLMSRDSSRGVAVRDIDGTLWKDMEPEAARNNRNVYMRRLRKMLQEVGDIEIVSDERYYVVRLNDTRVDINRTLDMVDYINGNSSRLSAVDKWSLIGPGMMKGPLLADVHASWLDSFKARYSQQCMNVLNSLLADNDFVNMPYERQLEIADTIFMHDELNEEALRIKCRILSERHVPAVARSVYDNFCKNYFRYMGEEFDVTFQDICR